MWQLHGQKLVCKISHMHSFQITTLLERRKESDTYLAADRRHHRSTQIAMKVDTVCSFQPSLWFSSAEEDDFHRDLRTPTMSSVSSQVGVALFPSY